MRNRQWSEVNPLYWPILSWTFGWSRYMPVILACLIIPSGLAPFIAAIAFVRSYKHNAKSLERIVCLYLALVLLCANINFIIMLHFSLSSAPPFHGIHQVWAERALSGNRTRYTGTTSFLQLLTAYTSASLHYQPSATEIYIQQHCIQN